MPSAKLNQFSHLIDAIGINSGEIAMNLEILFCFSLRKTLRKYLIVLSFFALYLCAGVRVCVRMPATGWDACLNSDFIPTQC